MIYHHKIVEIRFFPQMRLWVVLTIMAIVLGAEFAASQCQPWNAAWAEQCRLAFLNQLYSCNNGCYHEAHACCVRRNGELTDSGNVMIEECRARCQRTAAHNFATCAQKQSC